MDGAKQPDFHTAVEGFVANRRCLQLVSEPILMRHFTQLVLCLSYCLKARFGTLVKDQYEAMINTEFPRPRRLLWADDQ